MIVADVMTRDVVAVSPETGLAEAARWMVQHRLSGMPVLDEDGRLVGILSEGDLLRRPELGTGGRQAGWMRGVLRTETLAQEYAHTHGRSVGDVMTRNPVFVRPDMQLAKAVELMRLKRVKRLPVLREEVLVGMLSRFDMLRALSARLDETPVEASETEIREAIEAALLREPWAPRERVNFEVSGGLVRLEGAVQCADQARALGVLVCNTRGVSRVENALQVSVPAIPHADSRFSENLYRG